jgi:glyoxylase-like metal-dependent hydrolase (beta-lactamase superfamily II)
MVNTFVECTHVIWDETGEAVIIDCGVYKYGERERFIRFIEQKKLRPVRLLLTHAHHDHLYGNDLVRDRYGLLPEVHKDDEWIMKEHLPIRMAEIYKNYPYDIPMPEHYLTDGEVICFGNHALRVIHTPGHSPGSVFFYCEEARLAFSGDTLFSKDIGRTNLPFGSETDIYESLDRITQLLPDDTILYPGHGRKTTIGEEKEKNPFLTSPPY